MSDSKKLIENVFKLDKIDLKIMSSLNENPDMPYTEIAKHIDKSQPTVGMRMKKLSERGLLKKVYGIDFKKIDIMLAHISIQTSNIQQLTERINGNIGKILIWSSSGKYNLNMLICSKNMKDIGNMVCKLIKNEECIKLIKFEIINNLLTEFILPLKL